MICSKLLLSRLQGERLEMAGSYQHYIPRAVLRGFRIRGGSKKQVAMVGGTRLTSFSTSTGTWNEFFGNSACFLGLLKRGSCDWKYRSELMRLGFVV